jgi:hypothetical protein
MNHLKDTLRYENEISPSPPFFWKKRLVGGSPSEIPRGPPFFDDGNHFHDKSFISAQLLKYCYFYWEF